MLKPCQLELEHFEKDFCENAKKYLNGGSLLSSVIHDVPPTQLDVAIDGADEVDAELTLIKGGG